MKLEGMRKKHLLRLFSLLVSVLIWMYVVSSAEVEISKHVEVDISVPKNMAISNLIEKEVVYRFKGPGLFVRKFLENPMKVEIDSQSYYRKGKKNYILSIDRLPLKLPLGVELMSFEPRYINLVLEPKVKKKLKVIPQFSSELRNEYDIKEIKLMPEFIEVEGPKGLVSGLKNLETKMISKIDFHNGAPTEVELSPLDSRLTMTNSKILINYSYNSKKIDFTYKSVPIIFHSAQLISKSSHRYAMVKIQVKNGETSRPTNTEITVIATPKANVSGAQQVALKVNVPAGVDLVAVEPESIELELE